MIRTELTDEFYNVRDYESFYNFTTNTIGDFIFFEDLPQHEDHATNHEDLVLFLNSLNYDTLTLNSKGRIFVGPMRVL